MAILFVSPPPSKKQTNKQKNKKTTASQKKDELFIITLTLEWYIMLGWIFEHHVSGSF